MNIFLRDNLLKSTLVRFLPVARHERIFGDFTIVCDREGFTILREGSVRHLAPWSSIQLIIAHKRDLITMDLICFDVLLVDGTLIEVNEEMNGFETLLSALERNLAQFDKMWPDKVVQPPFVANETVIYAPAAA